MKFLIIFLLAMTSCNNNTHSNSIETTKSKNDCCILIKELSEKELSNKLTNDKDYIESYSDFEYYSKIFIDSIAKTKKCKIIRINNNNNIQDCKVNITIPNDFGIILIKGDKHLTLDGILTELDYFDIYNDFYSKKK